MTDIEQHPISDMPPGRRQYTTRLPGLAERLRALPAGEALFIPRGTDWPNRTALMATVSSCIWANKFSLSQRADPERDGVWIFHREPAQ